MNARLSAIVVSLAIALLSGCGGGGGGGSSAPASSTLGGVAAVGYPIVNATVQVKCAGGNALTDTTSSVGAWQVTISGQTLPCAVEVSGGTINGAANTTPYHSIATSFGTMNVTPLTDLMVANLAGTATPGTWFSGLVTASFASITPTSVNTALTKLRAALSGLTPLTTINPITTVFTAISGNITDDMLAALKTTIANTGITYIVLLTNASAPGFTSPGTSFNTALTTAYLNTVSGGGTGTGTGTGVTYSEPLGGFNGIADTHYDYASGSYVAGALTRYPGTAYQWNDASGALAILVYTPTLGGYTGVDFSGDGITDFTCYISFADSTILNTPVCSNIGVTFDKASGIITFESTPISTPPFNSPTGKTVTGSLTFAPF